MPKGIIAGFFDTYLIRIIMSNMKKHVLIKYFNLLTCAQHSIACRMLSVISIFLYVYSNYL